MTILKRPLRDKVALSFISGVLGTLVMYAVGFPIYFLKLSKLIYLIYDIELFVKPQMARTTPGLLAGILTGLIVGGGLAFIFKVILEWTGSDWLWLKSLAFSGLMWFFWVGVARNIMKITPYLFHDLRTNMMLLLQSVIYQMATTYFFIKLAGGKEFLEKAESK